MESDTEILTVAGQSLALNGGVYRPLIVEGLNKSRAVRSEHQHPCSGQTHTNTAAPGHDIAFRLFLWALKKPEFTPASLA